MDVTTREILLVEDSPSDARLTLEAFHSRKSTCKITHVEDGAEALAYLRKEGRYSEMPTPDLVLLDLNLPRKDGREFLNDMKKDPMIRTIPVIVFTTSKNISDVHQAYHLYANCYINKPIDFSDYVEVVKLIEQFWLNVVTLPPK